MPWGVLFNLLLVTWCHAAVATDPVVGCEKWY